MAGRRRTHRQTPSTAKESTRPAPPRADSRPSESTSSDTDHTADESRPNGAALGAALVDDAKAGDQLRELAACYEVIADAQTKYTRKSEDAKTAKKELDAATNHLLEKLREFTHAPELPLFDGDERERDHQAMLAAADRRGEDGKRNCGECLMDRVEVVELDEHGVCPRCHADYGPDKQTHVPESVS